MITLDEAKQIALSEIGQNLVLDESATLEKPFGWYFNRRTKDGDLLVGSNGFIVDRENGHIFQLGSMFPLERDFAAYEAGFRYDFYDLRILSVDDLPKTLDLLLKLGMTYVIPEEEYGTVWKIPRSYTPEQIEDALHSLPCEFLEQKFYFQFEIFLEIKKTGCCKHQLIGHYKEN
jgi:hypothetical protein